MKTEYRYIVGIDAGKNTGISIWDRKNKKFRIVQSCFIHTAMDYVKALLKEQEPFFVRVEDARKRKWFGNSGREQLQGAGSVKRDAVIWEDFLEDMRIPFEMVAPKNNKTKLTAEMFQKITNWQGRTNEHARDSAMLVYSY